MVPHRRPAARSQQPLGGSPPAAPPPPPAAVRLRDHEDESERSDPSSSDDDDDDDLRHAGSQNAAAPHVRSSSSSSSSRRSPSAQSPSPPPLPRSYFLFSAARRRRGGREAWRHGPPPRSFAPWLCLAAGLLFATMMGSLYYGPGLRRGLGALLVNKKVRPPALHDVPLSSLAATSRRKEGSTTAEEGPGEWEDKECTVWIAPSSLRGVNGYGVFTTRDLKEGESILGSPDGVAIPVEGYHPSHDQPNYESFRKFRELFDNYWWGRGVPDHVIYEAPPSIVDYQIGFGCLPNHHCVLSYLSTEYPTPPYVDSLADRYTHPSAGAFSYNRGREFTVSHALPAGSEIFLSYGWCDRASDAAPAWVASAYVTSDFEDAARLVAAHNATSKARRGKRRAFRRSSRSREAARSWGDMAVIRHMIRNTSLYDGAGILSVPTDTDIPELVQQLLPATRGDLEDMLERVEEAVAEEVAAESGGGGADAHSDDAQQKRDDELVRQIALSSLDRRSVDEIRAGGMCMDNLLARPSTIALAGQGGFAQRTIRAGELVAPAPLLQIMDRDALTLYGSDNEPNGTQLLLNYCFGHAESTLLLCPNTNAVLINHCSRRTKECGPDGPNAEYRWATGWDASSDAWRKMSFEELSDQTSRGLAFEIVALREIRPGDEVFIDYGEEWERAWARHVARWTPASFPPGWTPQDRWVSAEEANRDAGPVLPELISGDLRKTVHHPYLFTGCQFWETNEDVHPVYKKPRDWHDMWDEDVLDRYSDPGDRFCEGDHRLYPHHRDGSHWPCTVVDHNEEEDTYVVRIHRAPWATDSYLPWDDNELPRLLRNYKRDSIHYFVQPYASDQHLAGVFRHDIRIRDDIFPPQWKNVAGAAERH